jgi:hypothetical protein
LIVKVVVGIGAAVVAEVDEVGFHSQKETSQRRNSIFRSNPIAKILAAFAMILLELLVFDRIGSIVFQSKLGLGSGIFFSEFLENISLEKFETFLTN